MTRGVRTLWKQRCPLCRRVVTVYESSARYGRVPKIRSHDNEPRGATCPASGWQTRGRPPTPEDQAP